MTEPLIHDFGNDVLLPLGKFLTFLKSIQTYDHPCCYFIQKKIFFISDQVWFYDNFIQGELWPSAIKKHIGVVFKKRFLKAFGEREIDHYLHNRISRITANKICAEYRMHRLAILKCYDHYFSSADLPKI